MTKLAKYMLLAIVLWTCTGLVMCIVCPPYLKIVGFGALMTGFVAGAAYAGEVG